MDGWMDGWMRKSDSTFSIDTGRGVGQCLGILPLKIMEETASKFAVKLFRSWPNLRVQVDLQEFVDLGKNYCHTWRIHLLFTNWQE